MIFKTTLTENSRFQILDETLNVHSNKHFLGVIPEMENIVIGFILDYLNSFCLKFKTGLWLTNNINSLLVVLLINNK